MANYLGWCPDLAKRFNIQVNCCDCCHEDDEQEYSYLGQIQFNDGYYDTCCKMKESVTPPSGTVTTLKEI